MAALVAFAAQAQDRADRQELTIPIRLHDPAGRPAGPYTNTTSTSRCSTSARLWIADNVDHLNIKAVL